MYKWAFTIGTVWLPPLTIMLAGYSGRMLMDVGKGNYDNKVYAVPLVAQVVFIVVHACAVFYYRYWR